MQLFCESGDIDKAIEELKLALPIIALQNIIERRERHHKPRSGLRHRLMALRAQQLAKEVA
jgi:hypothetical protein